MLSWYELLRNELHNLYSSQYINCYYDDQIKENKTWEVCSAVQNKKENAALWKITACSNEICF
jgi:ribulose bisphosphate carboxylase small subunit